MEELVNQEPIFVGRKDELRQLENMYKTRRPHAIVIKGRRRVGKSRLVAEFAKNKIFWHFKAEPPKPNDTSREKLNEFRDQLQKYVNQEVPYFQNWFWALDFLSQSLKPGTVLLFDEISWMSHGDDSLVGKLKNFWDDIDHAGWHIMFFICGSVSTWIEKHITWGTALHGRLSWNIQLQPLSIPESVKILKQNNFYRSPRECVKLLSFFGGIPWYLQKAEAGESAAEAIKRMCFTVDGLLVGEFNIIFHDLFNGERGLYKQIMYILTGGMRLLSEIRKELNYSAEQEAKVPLEDLMKNLCVSGFVDWHYHWNIEKEEKLQLGEYMYRILDPYSRLYLKIIEPRAQDIEKNIFADIAGAAIPGLDGIAGLQFEQLLITNRRLMNQVLGVQPIEVLFYGPYRQFSSRGESGVQIDFLLHTKDKTVFVCEFKFSKNKLGTEIITEVKSKLDKIKLPVGGGFVPVLFHASGVTPEVEKSGFFGKIIEISELLEIDC